MEHTWRTLKLCRNELCSLSFYDRSRNNSAGYHDSGYAATSSTCARHERGNVRVRSTPNRTRRTPKSFDTHALLAASAWVIERIR